MKLSSQVWMKLESVGRPNDTKIIHATVRESMFHLAGWLNEVYMGSKIRITLARTQAELEESKRSSDVKDMLAELDGLLANDAPDGEADQVNGH